MAHPLVLTTDGASLGIAVSSFMGYLPPTAAVLSIIWTAVQLINFIISKRSKAAVGTDEKT